MKMVKVYIAKMGRYLRVRIYKGKYRPKEFRYHDIGTPGHTQRISAYNYKKGWFTYGFIFRLIDIKNRRPKTILMLRKLGITEKDLKRMNL